MVEDGECSSVALVESTADVGWCWLAHFAFIGDGVGDNTFTDKYLALTARISQSSPNVMAVLFVKISFIFTREIPAAVLLWKLVLVYMVTLLAMGVPGLLSL